MNKIHILDSSALLSVQQVLTYYSDSQSESTNLFFTTSDIVAELKDPMSKLRLESMISSETLAIKDVDPEFSAKIDQICLNIGNSARLSSQDKSVLALALQESEKDLSVLVILLTDDYEIQNTAKILHLQFKPVRTTGIKYSATFQKICQSCGEYLLAEDTSCPECGGTKILKKKSRLSNTKKLNSAKK